MLCWHFIGHRAERVKEEKQFGCKSLLIFQHERMLIIVRVRLPGSIDVMMSVPVHTISLLLVDIGCFRTLCSSCTTLQEDCCCI